MDPDAALAKLRELVTEINENREQAVSDPEWILTEFAEHFEALDNVAEEWRVPTRRLEEEMTHPTIPLSAWKRYRAGQAQARTNREAAAKAEQHLDRKVGNRSL